MSALVFELFDRFSKSGLELADLANDQLREAEKDWCVNAALAQVVDDGTSLTVTPSTLMGRTPFGALALPCACGCARGWRPLAIVLTLARLANFAESSFEDRRGHEARRKRTRRKLVERFGEPEHLVHRAIHGTDLVELPVPEGVGRNVGSLERVLEQIEGLLQSQLREGLRPDSHRAAESLLCSSRTTYQPTQLFR